MLIYHYHQVNIESDFVGVKNMTEKEQSMRGWTITKMFGEESLEYKFPAKASIGPGQMMKVRFVCGSHRALWGFGRYKIK